EWEHVAGTFVAADGTYQIYVPDGTYRIKFDDVSGAYQQPLYYDGIDNIGAATDVVVASGNVTGVDAHFVPDLTASPQPWRRSTARGRYRPPCRRPAVTPGIRRSRWGARAQRRWCGAARTGPTSGSKQASSRRRSPGRSR